MEAPCMAEMLDGIFMSLTYCRMLGSRGGSTGVLSFDQRGRLSSSQKSLLSLRQLMQLVPD